MHTCRSRFTLEILFTLCCILWIVPEVNLECAGIDTPFDILPEGDHIIEYGSILELYCKLNKNHPGARGLDSRDLSFYKLKGDEKIVLPNVTVVNDTTIKVDLVSPPLGSTYYYCSLNSSIVCLTNVLVGYKPQPVLDFQCTSYNWEKLHCYWTPPENPIKTEYRLNYTLKGRAGRIPRSCPNQLDIRNNSCLYDHETDPPIRQPHEYYYFELFGKNVLGNLSRSYTFHHYAHVIPNKPENVTIVNQTVGSATIGWNVPYPVFNFSPGLRLKIEYKNKWENWTEVEVPPNKKIYGKNHTFNITGLKYSHTSYEIRLYLKSFVAKAGPNDWSPPASVILLTPSTIPENPPLTTQGSFDIVSSGNDTDVFIYWARLPERFENGARFGYTVICKRGDGFDCDPSIENAASYAKFPISSQHSYTFTIYSTNEMGRSINNSNVYVPKYGSLTPPESFTKVVYDNGVFELSWKPVLHSDLSNYTLFWCKEDKDLPVPCKGYIDWEIVSKDTTSKNITMKDVTKFYKFAIAANLMDGTSSGMVWSSCVIFHDKVLKKVDDFRISKIGSREVDVVWEIRCAQSSAFRGFAFYYCPVDVSDPEDHCKDNETEEVIKIDGSQERNITLTDLKPYTAYKLQIAIISVDGSQQIQMGPRTTSQRFITLEDAPSVPLNLSILSVTNNTVRLSWNLPKELNGVLRSYKLLIKYPGVEKEMDFNAKNSFNNSLITQYQLQNLISFTTYNFTLKACTSIIKCSKYSAPAIITTLIGTPGKMKKPQVSILNSSMADVSWESPLPSGGPLNYYQLLITVDGGSEESEIFNLTGSRAKLELKACQEKSNTLDFRIRAININKNDVTHYGPWSEVQESYCGSSVWVKNSVLIDWISGTCTLLIVSACLIYIAKKGWLQCRKMKDVEVKLPSGLQSQDLEKDSQDYVHLERWPPRSPETVIGSTGTVLAPDQESLLDKKSDESMDITSFNMPVKNGGDSSGCSVGRESVSSSITSDTHISSDSGAEPDQCMIKPTSFEIWNSSGRRNGINVNPRNNPSKEVPTFPALGDWDLGEPGLPGYTKVGFTNGFIPEKTLPGKGYVTIASVTSVNPAQRTNSNPSSTGNSISAANFSSHVENSFPKGQELKNVEFKNQQPSSAPKYVSLAHFEGQKMGESSIPINMHNGGSPAGKLPKLSRLDESLERDDEKTEDSTDEDFSGKETDTETIHEVPITRKLAAMPPYVSMSDNPKIVLHVNDYDDDDDDDDEEEDDDTEDARLSKGTSTSGEKSISNGIDASLMNKENESFSNYIPHHLFEKESVHT